MKKLLVIGLLGLFMSNVFAVDVISVDELAKNLNNKNYVIVSARPAAEYGKVHIRNAINLPVTELSSDSPVKGILKSPDELAKIFGKHGISPEKTIVIYCNKGNNAGRMYWALKYLGAPNVKILDGNIDAWKAKRKPVTRTPTTLKATTFTPKVNKSLLVSMSDVKSKMTNSGTVLVDVRAAEYFNGAHAESKGHIPGAINFDSEMVKDSKGLIKPTSQLAGLLNSKGITKSKEIILYCNTSTRAGLVYNVLTSNMGYTNVKVYDGAYSEWASVSGNKLEK
jgi:thiosulfate/3-mercaptopyruvate sulfurtransferase